MTTNERTLGILKAVGNAVAEKRKTNNLSLRDVAEVAGISHFTIQRIEGGEDGTISNYLAVMQALGIPVSMLDGLEGVPCVTA